MAAVAAVQAAKNVCALTQRAHALEQLRPWVALAAREAGYASFASGTAREARRVVASQGHGGDRILVVDCPEEVQVERVVERSGWQPSQVRTIIAQQASRPRRRGIADAVIHNAGLSLDDLRDQVRDLFRLWVDRAPHDPLSNRPL